MITDYKISQKILKVERGILCLKRWFEDTLAQDLSLYRVSAPLFVESNSGIQDNLTGIENPVSFGIKAIPGKHYEIVHSLAKWKRFALARYKIPVGEGIYTDMNALRPDETTLSSGIHSVYVDQWDWEKVISEEERTLDYLKETVRTIYKAILKTEAHVCLDFGLEAFLPKKITFLHSEDVYNEYPHLTAKEREDLICEKYGAVFLIGIGGKLSNGEPHDGRSPDYDDWSTPTTPGHHGLNGDILVWNPLLKRSFELSSMGIRVSAEALIKQLEMTNSQDRLKLPWHQMLVSGELPLSIGGGIGQSRLSMLLMQKAHIGEVQASFWPDEVVASCRQKGQILL